MNEVIEILFEDFLVAHISTVVKFSKSQRNIDNFRTIFVAKTFVVFSSENSFYAFINQLWAYMINMVISTWIKIWMALWKNQNRFKCLCLLIFSCEFDSATNVSPFLRCVVSIEEYNLLCINILVLILGIWTVICNFIQISLMSLPKNFINGLMMIKIGMYFTVINGMLGQYFIKVNSQEFNLNISFLFWLHGSSLLEAIYFCALLFLMRVYSFVEVLLTSGTQKSRKSWFTHSWKTDWN